MRRGGPLVERFWARVKIADGCWEWQGTVAPRGYGYLHVGAAKWVKAHRFSYETSVGPIPTGLVVDHLCLNPQCVRPDHLEAVTQYENLSRSTIYNRNKTHCPRGHEYTPDNVQLDDGKRHCKTCRSTQSKARYAAKKGNRK